MVQSALVVRPEDVAAAIRTILKAQAAIVAVPVIATKTKYDDRNTDSSGLIQTKEVELLLHFLFHKRGAL